MSTFQIIVLGICAALILIGVGVFASFGGVLGGGSTGAVVIWGTLDSTTMDGVLTTLRSSDEAFQDVSYVEKSATNYDAELLNAMAAGTGPDLFLVSIDKLHSFSDKIITIPYRLVSQTSYLNAFFDESELFLTSQGELALPFLIDPLVMYWNRDLFAAAGLAEPPRYWNELLAIAPKITSLDRSNVTTSAVALGTWSNIAHAKEILSTLFIQAGDRVVVRGADGALLPTLGSVSGGGSADAPSALRFYTDFANPTKTTYSWNRGLPVSTNAFAAGDVAIYFGFVSEYPTLAARNPNLRFSVAQVPQVEGSLSLATFGRMTGLAIPRTARNIEGAAIVAEKLVGEEAIELIAQATGLPPVRRDISFDTSADANAAVFAQAALISRAWLDPSPKATDDIFKTMIESVISGAAEPATAVSTAAQALRQLVGR
ncbi:MAG: extracellular solute-binding protein [Patescibacteria group bacterium]|nr:extracellular solute-binding protein [Patescibacteria group bacterium]